MEMPDELRIALDTLTGAVPRERLARDARVLSERYRAGCSHLPYVASDDEALAYAAARMPATYCAVYTALRYSLGCTLLRPDSLLDVGAGTGAAAWAAYSLLDLSSVVCLEREGAMRRIGEALMRNAQWVSYDLSACAMPHRAGLVVASYVLGELGESERIRAVEHLWDAADGLLLLVEPGTPAGYARLARVRTHLLSLGAQLAAPCPHGEVCPLPPDDWCHYTCRVARSSLHRALKGGDVPYEDEKFCYFAFTRGTPSPATARVLRHPEIHSGYTTLELCTHEGLSRRTLSRKDGERYKRARKLSTGDQF